MSTNPIASTSSAAPPPPPPPPVAPQAAKPANTVSLIAFGTTQYRQGGTNNKCSMTIAVNPSTDKIAFFITKNNNNATLYTYEMNGNTPTNLLGTQTITKENLMVSLTGGKRKQKKQKGGLFDFGTTPCFSYQNMVLFTPEGNVNAKKQYGFGVVTQTDALTGLTNWMNTNLSAISLLMNPTGNYQQTSFVGSPCASLQVENPADDATKKTALTTLLQAVVTVLPVETGATKDETWANGNQGLKNLISLFFTNLANPFMYFSASPTVNTIGIENGKITVDNATLIKPIDADMLAGIRTAITQLRELPGVGDMNLVVDAAYGIVGVVYNIQSQKLNLCLNNFLYEILSQ